MSAAKSAIRPLRPGAFRIMVLVVIATTACGGDSSADPASTTTTTLISGIYGGVSGSGESSITTTSAAPETPADEPLGVAAGEGSCAVGRYELDGAYLFEQIAAASGGGGAEMVDALPILELRDDFSAELSMEGWMFRLSFPGESDTVLATQSGGLTGTWSVDDEGAHTLAFTSDTVSVQYLLETATGSFPVPHGMDAPLPQPSVPFEVDCADGYVVLEAEDQQLGVTVYWMFDRI